MCVCVRVVLYGLYCMGVSLKKKNGLPQNVDSLSVNQLIIIWSILVVQLFRDVGRPDRCTPSQECQGYYRRTLTKYNPYQKLLGIISQEC